MSPPVSRESGGINDSVVQRRDSPYRLFVEDRANAGFELVTERNSAALSLFPLLLTLRHSKLLLRSPAAL
jgi:hypothetical protein